MKPYTVGVMTDDVQDCGRLVHVYAESVAEAVVAAMREAGRFGSWVDYALVYQGHWDVPGLCAQPETNGWEDVDDLLPVPMHEVKELMYQSFRERDFRTNALAKQAFYRADWWAYCECVERLRGKQAVEA